MLRIIYQNSWTQFKTLEFYQDVLFEFVLSFTLLGCGTLLGCSLKADPGVIMLLVSLTSGLLVLALLEAFAHVTPALFNPALTFMMVCTGKLNIVKGVYCNG